MLRIADQAPSTTARFLSNRRPVWIHDGRVSSGTGLRAQAILGSKGSSLHAEACSWGMQWLVHLTTGGWTESRHT